MYYWICTNQTALTFIEITFLPLPVSMQFIPVRNSVYLLLTSLYPIYITTIWRLWDTYYNTKIRYEYGGGGVTGFYICCSLNKNTVSLIPDSNSSKGVARGIKTVIMLTVSFNDLSWVGFWEKKILPCELNIW